MLTIHLTQDDYNVLASALCGCVEGIPTMYLPSRVRELATTIHAYAVKQGYANGEDDNPADWDVKDD